MYNQVVAFILIVVAFFLGSIPFGFLIVKLLYRADIRRLGSGNIGMTNVWRNFGWKPGLATLVLDFLKGLAPVILAFFTLRNDYSFPNPYLVKAGSGSLFSSYASSGEFVLTLVAIFAILGHSFTPWLLFKGGKGFATALGAMAGLLQVYLLIPLAVFLIFFLMFRFVSLGSISASFAFLLTTIFVPELRFYIPLGVALVLVILYTHRENISRLIRGTEPRFNF